MLHHARLAVCVCVCVRVCRWVGGQGGLAGVCKPAACCAAYTRPRSGGGDERVGDRGLRVSSSGWDAGIQRAAASVLGQAVGKAAQDPRTLQRLPLELLLHPHGHALPAGSTRRVCMLLYTQQYIAARDACIHRCVCTRVFQCQRMHTRVSRGSAAACCASLWACVYARGHGRDRGLKIVHEWAARGGAGVSARPRTPRC